MTSDTESFLSSALEQTVCSVFETMLGISVTTAPGVVRAPEPSSVTAIVRLTGPAWSGTVGLRTSAALACELAGHYLSVPSPACVGEDVRDVLGELVNMIGGNIKSALCPGATLSMPLVIDGDRHRLMTGVGIAEIAQAFACNGSTFWVFRTTDGLELN